MPRIPTPLIWKRRNFAVFEHLGMIDRLYAVALDLNWWTCLPEEVIAPDLQEMRNIHERLKPTPWIASDWGRGTGERATSVLLAPIRCFETLKLRAGFVPALVLAHSRAFGAK
jgi:hypothetical protein